MAGNLQPTHGQQESYKDVDGKPVLTVSVPGSPSAGSSAGGAAPPGSPSKQTPPVAASAIDQPAMSYFKLYRGCDTVDCILVILGLVGGLGNGVMLPLFSIVFGDFTNIFGTYIPPCFGLPPLPGFMTDQEFNSAVSSLALKFLYLAIGAACAGFLQQFCWTYTSVRQTNRLRRRYLAAVLRQDVSFFDTQATTGGLLQGLSDDALAVQQSISDKVGTFLQHTATFVVGFVIAFTRSWDMTLVMVGCLPFLAAVGGILAKLTTTLTNKATAAYTEAGAVVQQSLSQIRTVAAYNGEEAAAKSYDAKLDLPQKVGQQQGATAGLALGGMQFTMFCSYALALYYGATRVSQGHMTGGAVVNVLFAALLGSFSLGLAAPNLQYFSKGASAGSRLFAVINREPDIDIEEVGDEPPECVGELRLEHVSFRYPARPDVMVMKGFSLDVKAGTTVALVGSSGSGKSTVVGLIERFYDPVEGRVLLDGRDIKTLKLHWLRTHVGLVSQEPTLFQTTIYDNIAMGRPGATEDEIHEAAQRANAHKFISIMPAGYSTQVGERGMQLSGGQKQRIAIARAILKNPKILLLDEATSALDSESEKIVQDALDRMVVGRTTVVVAHRLSTIQNADVIAVMQQGVLVEQGSHKTLLQNPTGAYTNLVKLQMQQQEQEQHTQAEVEEVLESGGKPVTRHSLERVLSRRRSHASVDSEGGAAGSLKPAASIGNTSTRSVEDMLAAETHQVATKLSGAHSKELQQVLVTDEPGSTGGSVTSAAAASGEAASRLAASQPTAVPAALSTEAAAAAAVGTGAGVTRRRGWFSQRRGGKDNAVADSKEAEGDADGKRTEGEPVKVPFSRLMALNKPEWPYLLCGIVSSAAVGGVQPGFAFLLSAMTTTFFLQDSNQLRSTASFYGWMFFVIACGVFIAATLQQWSFAVMGAALSRRIRQMLFRSILRQDIGWFDRDENSSGQLGSSLSTDAAVIRGAVGDVFGVVFQNLACMAAGYCIAFVYNWRTALLITGTAPLVALGGMLHVKLVFGNNTESDKIYSTANSAVTEAISSIRVIQAYNLQAYVCQTYQKLLHEVNAKNKMTSVVGGLSMGYFQLVMFSIYALITWFGGLELSSCRSTFDAFLKSFFAVLFSVMGLAQAQVGFPDLAKAKGALTSVFKIVDRVSPIDPASTEGLTLDSRAVRGEVELQNVVFAYPARPSVKVFNNFCLHIPAGQTVALVGESGSGKSTVVGLIERFYDPVEGRVLLDGRDIREYNVGWLRRQIGLVSQEPLLFSGSVLDNIMYGKPDATTAEVEAAARVANAHDFISALPEAYNTKVGERGVQLSGGQKQRVAIARAVLKDPKILLLDEATSALDAASEHLVQDALDRIMHGRTSVVVAHRLSTIRNASSIAVVYRGVILEQGTHQELLAIPNGGYARLVAAQMKTGGAAKEG